MNYVLKSASTVEEAIELGLKELGLDREDADIEIIEEGSSGFLGLIGKKEAVVRIGKKDDSNISSFVKDILYDKEEEIEKEEKQVKKPVKTVKEEITKTQVKDKKEKIIQEEKIQEKEEIQEKIKVEENIDQMEEDNREFWSDEKIVDFSKDFLSKILDEMEIDYFINTRLEGNSLEIEIGSSNPDDLGIVIGSRGSTLDALEYLINLVLNNYRKEYLRVNLDANNYRGKRMANIERLARKGADKVYKSGRPYRLEPMNAADRRIVHMILQDYSYLVTKSEGRDPNRRVVIYKKQLDEE